MCLTMADRCQTLWHMSNKLRKGERLTFRLTKEQRRLLDKVAAKLQKRPSDLVRDAVLREIASTQAAA